MDPVGKQIAELREHIAASTHALDRAAMISTLNDDPVKEQLLAYSLGLRALLSVCETGAAVQQDISASLDEKAEIVAEQALAHVKNSTEEIVSQAVPRVLELVARASSAKIALAKRKVLLIGTGAILAAEVVLGGYAYAIGFSNGHITGVQTAQTIDAYVGAHGPEGAADWAMLMIRNDPIPNLAQCRKDIEIENGKPFCLMPVWIGANPSPPLAGS